MSTSNKITCDVCGYVEDYDAGSTSGRSVTPGMRGWCKLLRESDLRTARDVCPADVARLLGHRQITEAQISSSSRAALTGSRS